MDHTIRKSSPIFFGPDGLRAGWALLIAVSFFLGLFYVVSRLLWLFHVAPHAQATSVTPGAVLYSEGVAFLILAAVTWIMSRIEGRPVSTYGLGGQRRLQFLLTGAFWGLAFLSLLVLMLVKTGHLVIDGSQLHGRDIVRYALLWIPPFLTIALFEEYLFRGYLLYTLTRGFTGLYARVADPSRGPALGFWTSAILISIGFGLTHGSNTGESPVGLFSAAFIALVFCFSIWRTGSLWWAIGFHAAWDWAESFLYGVADSGVTVRFHLLATHPVGQPLLSGGATGPEGSLFALPVAVLAAITIAMTLRGKSNYSDLLKTANAVSGHTDSLPGPIPVQPFEERRR